MQERRTHREEICAVQLRYCMPNKPLWLKKSTPKPPSEKRKRKEFSIMPDELLGDKNLSPSAKLVYLGFAKFADHDTGLTWASRETVAKLLDLSMRTVTASLTLLNEQGWIVTHNRGQGKTAYRYVRFNKAPNKKRKTRQKMPRQEMAEVATENKTHSSTDNHGKIVPFAEVA